jgi:hypothetical protein
VTAPDEPVERVIEPVERRYGEPSVKLVREPVSPYGACTDLLVKLEVIDVKTGWLMIMTFSTPIGAELVSLQYT